MSEENKKMPATPPAVPKPPAVPPAAQKPKDHRTALIVAIVAAAVAVIGIIVSLGVGFAYAVPEIVSEVRNEIAEPESSISIYSYEIDPTEYRVWITEDEYVNPNADSEKMGEVDADSYVFITEIAEDPETGARWGRIDGGGFILLEDEDELNAEEVEWFWDDRFDSDVIYEAAETLPVYDSEGSKTDTTYKKGDTIPFSDFESDQFGRVRGLFDDGSYVVVVNDGSTMIQEAETVDDEHDYEALYEVNIRKEPSVKASKSGTLKEGDIITIVRKKTVDEDKKRVWGEIDTGGWVCLEEDGHDFMEDLDE